MFALQSACAVAEHINAEIIAVIKVVEVQKMCDLLMITTYFSLCFSFYDLCMARSSLCTFP